MNFRSSVFLFLLVSSPVCYSQKNDPCYTISDGHSTIIDPNEYENLNKSILNTINFTVPDTVCVGSTINITNLSQGASTYYWNFCSGSANNTPTGVNIGNPGGLLSIPTYITLVQQGTDCFSFISCQGVGVIRYYHGTSFKNNPVSWTNLGQFGLINFNEEGIQIKKDNGNWYGFVNSYTTIIRLNFGNSLWNTPTAVDIGPLPSLNMPHGLVITQDGTNWIGLVTCSLGQKLVRLNFGTSLTNIPVATDFGSFSGILSSPFAICLVQENSLWYALIIASGSSLARVTFGTSLLNTPSCVSLGNPGGFNSALGLTLLRDCESTTGYWTNYLVNGQLGKLTFPSGILGPANGTVLGNIGALARPGPFSEIFRQHDTLYAYINNRDNGTMTRLTFPPCNNASIISSTLFTPPPFSYNQSGTYNVHLIIDEGLPAMLSLCKPIVVMDPPVINLGNDVSICQGNTVTLDAGPNFSSYLWSTGATTQTITVATAGTYTVNATRWGCSSSDNITVSVVSSPSVNLGSDKTICAGQTQTFDAGFCTGCSYQWGDITTGQTNIGTGQTYTTGTAGKYNVTVTNSTGCIGKDTVQLFVNTTLPVSLTISASANPVCQGIPVTFNAIPVNGGTSPVYAWYINGSIVGTNSQFFIYVPASGDQVNCTMNSNDPCSTNNPATSNTVAMTVSSNLPVSVSITPSANPVCAGTTVMFTATPQSGGIAPSYQWFVNGNSVGTNSPVYSFVPNNGDLVSCTLTSSETCTSGNPASSIQYPVSVNPILPVSVSVTISANTVCAGTTVTCTATPQSGGISPSYQWFVNGISAGTNSPAYSFVPGNGDLVSCTLTSSETCTTGNPASSIQYPVSVNPLLPVSVSVTVSANPVCAGTSVTFNASSVNPGTSPTWTWFVNGIVSGSNNNSFTYIPATGDQVSCNLSSNAACATGNPASSNTIGMGLLQLPAVTFIPCFDTITSTDAKPFKLKGGIPLGGIYSGPGVNSLTGVFTPLSAGTGTKTITYSSVNSLGCSAGKLRNIIVKTIAPFTCGNLLIDIRDTKSYPTTQIGTQCWLAANLDFGTMIPGDIHQTDNCVAEKYCYNNLASGCGTGTLYQWDELMKFDDTPAGQGLCPPGWHIPTETDWNVLFNFYTSNAFAGYPLLHRGFSGFIALLPGVNHLNQTWNYQGFATFFWSSSMSGSKYAWSHGLNWYDPSVSSYSAGRANAFSVRCLKD